MIEEESIGEESVVDESTDEETVDESDVDEEQIEAFDESSEWKTLKDHPDYEICVNYPHQIRKKSNERIVKESTNKVGYLCVHLNGKSFYKHRLIALQFIPNPDNLPQIDHINHIKTDNRISNIRWCSHIQNNNNKGKSWTGRIIEYVQQLPENAVIIEKYSRFEFKGVYFHGDLFYIDTRNDNYRIVPTCMSNGRRMVSIRDIYGIQRGIYYDRLLREYGLN